MKNALSFKQPKLLNETSRLDFGQYKGQTIGEIMKFDAQYLVWLVEKKIIDIEATLYDDILTIADGEEWDRIEHHMWDDVDEFDSKKDFHERMKTESWPKCIHGYTLGCPFGCQKD